MVRKNPTRAMKQRILSYRKAPVTQAKRLSLFHCPRVLLSHSVARFDSAPSHSHFGWVELKDKVSPNKARPPIPTPVCSRSALANLVSTYTFRLSLGGVHNTV